MTREGISGAERFESIVAARQQVAANEAAWKASEERLSRAVEEYKQTGDTAKYNKVYQEEITVQQDLKWAAEQTPHTVDIEGNEIIKQEDYMDEPLGSVDEANLQVPVEGFDLSQIDLTQLV